MNPSELEAIQFVRDKFHDERRADDVRTVLNRLIMGDRDWKTGKELGESRCTCQARQHPETDEVELMAPPEGCALHPEHA